MKLFQLKKKKIGFKKRYEGCNKLYKTKREETLFEGYNKKLSNKGTNQKEQPKVGDLFDDI